MFEDLLKIYVPGFHTYIYLILPTSAVGFFFFASYLTCTGILNNYLNAECDMSFFMVQYSL